MHLHIMPFRAHAYYIRSSRIVWLGQLWGIDGRTNKRVTEGRITGKNPSEGPEQGRKAL